MLYLSYAGRQKRQDGETITVTIGVVRVFGTEGLSLPDYQTSGAAGADILAAVESPITLLPGKRAIVPTGLRLDIPAGFEVQIRPRSGWAAKDGVTVLNAPGCIDSDFRGECLVILVNHGEESVTIRRGDRIAQMVVAPVVRASFVRLNALSETARGDGGFGSTGRGEAGPTAGSKTGEA